MATTEGFIVEYYTYTDGWRQAVGGRLWKTERGAEGFRQRWADEQKRGYAWEPPTRVTPLARAGSALVGAAA